MTSPSVQPASEEGDSFLEPVVNPGATASCQRCVQVEREILPGVFEWRWTCLGVERSTKFNSARDCEPHATGCTMDRWCLVV